MLQLENRLYSNPANRQCTSPQNAVFLINSVNEGLNSPKPGLVITGTVKCVPAWLWRVKLQPSGLKNKVKQQRYQKLQLTRMTTLQVNLPDGPKCPTLQQK